MVPDKITLNTDLQDIEKYIVEEENMDDLNDIVKLYNISLKKKDLVRNSKLSEVQDKIVEQITTRVLERPDNFSNEDLLKYYKTIQDTLSRSDKSFEGMKAPTIQLNQQINIDNQGEFNRESRKKIIDTVNQILSAAKENSQDLRDVIDLSEGDIETTND